jgi:hypothetical protein
LKAFVSFFGGDDIIGMTCTDADCYGFRNDDGGVLPRVEDAAECRIKRQVGYLSCGIIVVGSLNIAPLWPFFGLKTRNRVLSLLRRLPQKC